MIPSRKIRDEWNVFEGFFGNFLFLVIFLGIVIA
jgi:hypothetical protein